MLAEEEDGNGLNLYSVFENIYLADNPQRQLWISFRSMGHSQGLGYEIFQEGPHLIYQV